MARSREHVLSLIAKLQEIRVERGATPAEAETAALKISVLLERYQLSMLDVQQNVLHEGMLKEELEMDGYNLQTWWYALARAVSEPHDCSYISTKGNKERNLKAKMTFCGYESDVKVANYLFVMLKRLLDDAADIATKNYYGESHRKSFRTEFLVAAATRIGERLKQQRKESQQSQEQAVASSSCALVAIKQPAVKKFYEESFPNRYTIKSAPRRYVEEGRAAGRKYADSVNLRKGVETTQRGLLS